MFERYLRLLMLVPEIVVHLLHRVALHALQEPVIWDRNGLLMETDKRINKSLRILKLNKKFTLKDIEESFRRLAVKYHPDRCCEKEKAKCREKFKEITVAKKILEDYYTSGVKPINTKDVIKKTKIYRKHIREYQEHIERFYSEWFGLDIK